VSLESTRTLVRRAQEGDHAARDRLLERCLPMLRRWARGRLPRYARDLADTDDLVQTTLMRTLGHLDEIRFSHSGSFLAYLRQVLLNAARDEMRRSQRRRVDSDREAGESPDDLPSPDGAPGSLSPEKMLDYERALKALPEPQRQAVVLRLEFGLSYPEIAIELESPSANATRMMVSRSLVRLARDLAGRDTGSPDSAD
jgi:RNA polymerase sigma-70 factor (ECF subfamily)